MQKITGLTHEQINHLFAFARSKGVEDLDLQDEVVKELSEKISFEMKEKPSLDFHQALANVYARFPITGFAVFLLEKQREIRRYGRMKYYKSFRNFWMSRRIFGILLIFGICFTTSFLGGKWGIWIFFILAVLLYYTITYRIRRKLVAPYKELNKLYFYRRFHMYFDDGLDRNTDYPALHRLLIWSWFVFFPLNMDFPINNLFRVFAAVLSGMLLVTAYHTYVEMPKLINEEIKNRFSHLIELKDFTRQE